MILDQLKLARSADLPEHCILQLAQGRAGNYFQEWFESAWLDNARHDRQIANDKIIFEQCGRGVLHNTTPHLASIQVRLNSMHYYLEQNPQLADCHSTSQSSDFMEYLTSKVPLRNFTTGPEMIVNGNSS
ncbi:hypothetical protein JCM33374_g1145 [Metschnikowia sp. JCM 33374]|nr:hypothetical protein JCM33374_g1145 [Metschnikowia sp. JCM 33374]